MFDLDVADVKKMSMLVERLVAVSRCTENQMELKTVMELVAGRAKRTSWLEVYRLVTDRHSDLMLTVWTVIPGLRLSAGDLQQVVVERREAWRLGLPLEVTRFLVQTVDSSELKSSCLAEVSVGYWSARGHLPPPDWLSTHLSLRAWTDSSHSIHIACFFRCPRNTDSLIL